jgi:hypothetical protein
MLMAIVVVVVFVAAGAAALVVVMLVNPLCLSLAGEMLLYGHQRCKEHGHPPPH